MFNRILKNIINIIKYNYSDKEKNVNANNTIKIKPNSNIIYKKK